MKFNLFTLLIIFYFFNYPSLSAQEKQLTITEPCTVFISPDSSEIEAMKKKYGAENFYVSADDNMFYIAEARQFLEKKNLQIINTEVKNLSFKKKNGKFIKVDLRKQEPNWIVILFDGESDPKQVDFVDIISEYEKYFKKKK